MKMEERYVLIDLSKVSCGTVSTIGMDYRIKPDEKGIFGDNTEGYYRYLDKIVDYLREETKRILGQEEY